MDKLKLYKIYELVMVLLALIVVMILTLEFTMEITEATSRLFSLMDTGILVIFAMDYFIRLFMAKDKKTFVMTNKADFIAIIPFSSMFRIFRIARLARLARLSRLNRLVRAGVWVGKFRLKLLFFLKTNGLIYMISLTLLMVLGGALGIYLFEGMSFSDGIWWSFVTTTTVGYGDLSPESFGGRVVAAILMLVGIGFIGMLTGTIATYFLGGKDQPPGYKRETVERAREKLGNFEDLSEEELQEMFTILLAIKREEHK